MGEMLSGRKDLKRREVHIEGNRKHFIHKIDGTAQKRRNSAKEIDRNRGEFQSQGEASLAQAPSSQ